MKESVLRGGLCLWRSLPSIRLRVSVFNKQLSHYAAAAGLDGESPRSNLKTRGEWLTLPPFSPVINASKLGKQLAVNRRGAADGNSCNTTTTMTALKWVLHCCPQLPRSLVQKLFRLRQVRREFPSNTSSDLSIQIKARQLRRIAAKDSMKLGDQIFLPISVKDKPSTRKELSCDEEDTSFIHSLVLYKDPAIIVVNKPPGMPVQGGTGIKRSLDELAAACLKFDYSEHPRLVHRLDRDSSGILVMGRTLTCATLLHSVFREKTFGASKDLHTDRKILRRLYCALVIGCPRLPRGLISAPLGKVVLDGGTSDRITIINNAATGSSQHAITEYQVITSCHGYAWLELSPVTGRKHQLRVHCAEALGTPIVGDYKYGRLAHKKLKHLPWYNLESNPDLMASEERDPSGPDLRNSNISRTQPHLHLHCKEMSLPNVAMALKNQKYAAECDLSELECLNFVAPLPSHMQKSWEFLHS